MNIMIWAVQFALAAMFAMAGYGKVSASRSQHIADGHIGPDSSVLPIRILGIAEWLGCIGIIVPWVTGVLPVLTPFAAVGFSLVMLMGIGVHVRKKEYKMLPLLLCIFTLAALVAYVRFFQLSRPV